jgi:LPS-assembly protein
MVAAAQDRAELEYPYQHGVLRVAADRLFKESSRLWVAEGDVVATYEDITLKTSRLAYNLETKVVTAEGGVEIIRGVQWLKGTRGEFQLNDRTGHIENAEGYTDEQLFVRAKVLFKTGPDTFRAQGANLTSCTDPVPKWSFSSPSSIVRADSWATIKHPVLKIKNVPVFYLPLVTFPTGKKERSSGLMIPSYGRSELKGHRFTQPLYLTLGRSADVLVRADYYSKRGVGAGATFRAKPNSVTRLHLDAYTINDRLDQGGTSFNGTAETKFGEGFRLAADFNLVSDFIFRRVFSDSFYAATKPTEDSRVFLTNNFGAMSFNVRASQQETIFPERNVVARSAPAFNFRLHGQRLGQLPIYLDLDTSAEGMSRRDSQLETPTLSQRLDFQPAVYFSLPLFQGLRVTPRLSVRETMYGDRLEIDEDGNTSVSGKNLNRQYLDFTLDLRGWGLSKIYSKGSGWKHLIEPSVRYRYISGINRFHETILFDENDAIANTNEVEYAIINSLFVREATREGTMTREWLTVKIGQKYFFDPDFGGALVANSANQFFPLYTMTGFPYAYTRRLFAPLTTVARWNPSRRVSFDVRGDFDFKFSRFRNLAITGYLNRNRLGFSTTYFVTQELEPGTQEHNQLQGQIWAGNRVRGLSFSGLFSYDAKERDFLSVRARGKHVWDCCGVAVEFQRISVGFREEREIRFSFFLKGLGAFGTIRRQERLF